MNCIGIKMAIGQNLLDISELDQNALMGFILLLFTTKHKDPPTLLKHCLRDLMPTYWMIFNNNNDQLL
jgi:hypothetical protein